MFKRALMAAGVAVTLLGPAAAAHAAASCTYVLGFATMAGSVSQVGSCVDDQTFADNGDAVQHSSGGLLVWRKADNWTAFTDGYHTWVNGPNGVQERLNSDRFPWEAATPPPTTAATTTTAAVNPPTTTTTIPTTATYTPPTAASLGLSGASLGMIAPPEGAMPSAAELAQVPQPAGSPPLASLPDPVKLACYHLSQDIARADSVGSVALQRGDFLCPYATVTGWGN